MRGPTYISNELEAPSFDWPEAQGWSNNDWVAPDQKKESKVEHQYGGYQDASYGYGQQQTGHEAADDYLKTQGYDHYGKDSYGQDTYGQGSYGYG